jgi:hypothetical protein
MSLRRAFAECYERNLRKALKTRPDKYMWPVENVPVVVKKMLDAVDRGSFNKDSLAFKWTCKELGIKHTYQAIREYWNG